VNTTDQAIIDASSDWAEFEKNATETDHKGVTLRPNEKEKLDLALKIRVKLKEYRMSEIQLSVTQWTNSNIQMRL